MNNNPMEKVVWVSGEICDTSGIYYSDTCGHPIRKEFRATEMFLRCPTCMQTLRWMRFDSKQVALFDFKTPSAFGISNVSSGRGKKN
jgi:hypothetical protein